MTRLRILPLLIALTATMGVAACNKPGGAVVTGKSGAGLGDDFSIGDAKAKVTVVEYASASCSHCARWDQEVFPAFKAKYIDTGKVRYVYREFLTGPEQYAAAAFVLARCAGPDKYLQVVEGAYRGQAEMFANQDMRTPLLHIAQSIGMNEEQFTACTGDAKALTALNDRVQKAVTEAKVSGTPTFEVNGKRLGGPDGGEQPLDKLSAAIDPLLAKP